MADWINNLLSKENRTFTAYENISRNAGAIQKSILGSTIGYDIESFTDFSSKGRKHGVVQSGTWDPRLDNALNLEGTRFYRPNSDMSAERAYRQELKKESETKRYAFHTNAVKDFKSVDAPYLQTKELYSRDIRQIRNFAKNENKHIGIYNIGFEGKALFERSSSGFDSGIIWGSTRGSVQKPGMAFLNQEGNSLFAIAQEGQQIGGSLLTAAEHHFNAQALQAGARYSPGQMDAYLGHRVAAASHLVDYLSDVNNPKIVYDQAVLSQGVLAKMQQEGKISAFAASQYSLETFAKVAGARELHMPSPDAQLASRVGAASAAYLKGEQAEFFEGPFHQLWEEAAYSGWIDKRKEAFIKVAEGSGTDYLFGHGGGVRQQDLTFGTGNTSSTVSGFAVKKNSNGLSGLTLKNLATSDYGTFRSEVSPHIQNYLLADEFFKEAPEDAVERLTRTAYDVFGARTKEQTAEAIAMAGDVAKKEEGLVKGFAKSLYKASPLAKYSGAQLAMGGGIALGAFILGRQVLNGIRSDKADEYSYSGFEVMKPHPGTDFTGGRASGVLPSMQTAKNIISKTVDVTKRTAKGLATVTVGMHSPLHTVGMIRAFKHVHGRNTTWKEAATIALHDVGYVRTGNKYGDAIEGYHPEIGGKIAGALFGEKYEKLAIGHSKGYADLVGGELSELYLPDKIWLDFVPKPLTKLSHMFEPSWATNLDELLAKSTSIKNKFDSGLINKFGQEVPSGIRSSNTSESAYSGFEAMKPHPGTDFPGGREQLFNLALKEIRRPNGAIGVQGFSNQGIRDILGFVSNEPVPGKTSREAVDWLKSRTDVASKLREFINKEPIVVSELPDSTLTLTDGHHRAFLIDQLGDPTIPAKITDYTGASIPIPSGIHANANPITGINRSSRNAIPSDFNSPRDMLNEYSMGIASRYNSASAYASSTAKKLVPSSYSVFAGLRIAAFMTGASNIQEIVTPTTKTWGRASQFGVMDQNMWSSVSEDYEEEMDASGMAITTHGSDIHAAFQERFKEILPGAMDEFQVIDWKSKIAGEIDLLVPVKDAKGKVYPIPLEIKTATTGAIDMMTAPKPEHIAQSQFYMHALSKENPDRKPPFEIFAYISRTDPSKYKIFLEERDERKYQYYLSRYRQYQNSMGMFGPTPQRLPSNVPKMINKTMQAPEASMMVENTGGAVSMEDLLGVVRSTTQNYNPPSFNGIDRSHRRHPSDFQSPLGDTTLSERHSLKVATQSANKSYTVNNPYKIKISSDNDNHFKSQRNKYDINSSRRRANKKDYKASRVGV